MGWAGSDRTFIPHLTRPRMHSSSTRWSPKTRKRDVNHVSPKPRRSVQSLPQQPSPRPFRKESVDTMSIIPIDFQSCSQVNRSTNPSYGVLVRILPGAGDPKAREVGRILASGFGKEQFHEVPLPGRFGTHGRGGFVRRLLRRTTILELPGKRPGIEPGKAAILPLLSRYSARPPIEHNQRPCLFHASVSQATAANPAS